MLIVCGIQFHSLASAINLNLFILYVHICDAVLLFFVAVILDWV